MTGMTDSTPTRRPLHSLLAGVTGTIMPSHARLGVIRLQTCKPANLQRLGPSPITQNSITLICGPLLPNRCFSHAGVQTAFLTPFMLV